MTTIAVIENITRQTEKAIQFDAGDRLVWAPKSILTIEDNGVINAPLWFAKKNCLGCYGYRKALVG